VPEARLAVDVRPPAGAGWSLSRPPRQAGTTARRRGRLHRPATGPARPSRRRFVPPSA